MYRRTLKDLWVQEANRMNEADILLAELEQRSLLSFPRECFREGVLSLYCGLPYFLLWPLPTFIFLPWPWLHSNPSFNGLLRKGRVTRRFVIHSWAPPQTDWIRNSANGALQSVFERVIQDYLPPFWESILQTVAELMLALSLLDNNPTPKPLQIQLFFIVIFDIIASVRALQQPCNVSS